MNLRIGLRVLAVYVAAAMLLAACGKNESAPEAQPSAAGTAPAQSASATTGKPVEISWLSFDFPDQDGSLVQTWMEKKFNVKIKNIRIDRANWRDQLNIKLASGEVPDVWLLWGIQDVDLYSRQGLLTELPVDEIKKSIPNLAKLIDTSDPGAWINGIIGGKNYGIPITNLDGRYPYFPLYNENWLKKIGYNAPPKTLAELEDVLYKFRNNDPDGNSKKDTYGLGGKGKSSQAQSFPAVFGAFNVQPFFWKLGKDGNLAYGITTPEAREAFRLLNKWFKDGVLDPEFITSDGNKEEFGNALVGMGYESWNHIRPSGKVAQLAGKNGFKLAIGGALTGPDGTGSLMAFGLTSNYLGMGADVAKNPEKKKKIYEILNSFYSDRESILYSQFGEENIHYTMQNGKPMPKQEYVAREAQLKLGLGNYYGLFARKTTEFETYLYPDSDLQFRETISKNVPMLIDPVKFNVPSLAKFPDLANMEKEYFIKFITGEVNLDAGFDGFVDKWMKAGGKTVTDEVNKLYKEYNKK